MKAGYSEKKRDFDTWDELLRENYDKLQRLMESSEMSICDASSIVAQKVASVKQPKEKVETADTEATRCTEGASQ